MSQMLKSSGAMAAATMTSRVLGMVREMVYANFMGNSWVASAFTLAFMVPNLFRRLLGEGALTAAFIPIFKHKEKTAGEAEMWRAANAVISGLMISAGAITIVAILGISVVLGVGSFPAETTLMLQLLRFMFPYMLLACLAAVLIGMANARGHFFVPALGAVLLNVVMITSVLLMTYAPQFKDLPLEQRIFGLAVGVVLAGAVQACFQIPSLRREGFRYQWVSPWGDPTVREVVKKMIPGSIGVAAFQINVLVTQGCSFWFDTSITSTFNYAVRLMELPQGVFGISLATFLLPALSGLGGGEEVSRVPRHAEHGVELHLVHESHRGGGVARAGRADRAVVVRAREIRSGRDAAGGAGAGVSRAGVVDVFDEQHFGPGVLCVERHPDPDEDQCGVSGVESGVRVAAGSCVSRGGPGHREQLERDHQHGAVALRAAAQAGEVGIHRAGAQSVHLAGGLGGGGRGGVRRLPLVGWEPRARDIGGAHWRRVHSDGGGGGDLLGAGDVRECSRRARCDESAAAEVEAVIPI
jgi:hypothetical protein